MFTAVILDADHVRPFHCCCHAAVGQDRQRSAGRLKYHVRDLVATNNDFELKFNKHCNKSAFHWSRLLGARNFISLVPEAKFGWDSTILRRTSSVFSPVSQPFSTCNCRPYYLLGNLTEFFCFLCSASTAQHSTAHSTRSSSKASTRRSERDNASKQTELARASMSSSIYTARSIRNERRNGNLPGLQKYSTGASG